VDKKIELRQPILFRGDLQSRAIHRIPQESVMKRRKRTVRRRNYPTPGPQQLGLSVDEACNVSGLGRSSIAAAIKSGELRARKLGKRIVIMRPDVEAYVRNLPLARAEAR
jgi:excisionase family DNA binding protein